MSMENDDPFAIFDAPPPTADEDAIANKRARPSPIVPLVRHFIARHSPATVSDLRAAGEAALASMLELSASHIAADPPALEQCRDAAQQVVDEAWTNVSGSKEGVKSLAREAYVLGQALLCAVRAALDGDARGALGNLDRAFILGGHTQLFRDCIELLDEAPAREEKVTPVASTAPEASTLPTPLTFPPGSGVPIERMALPTSATDFRAIHARGRPVVLEGVASSWPAMRKWADLDWLRAQHGTRLVPVELGTLARGEEGTWGERIMCLGDFIDGHLAHTQPDLPVGYLAQHPLFEQIPRLRDDFAVPPICSATGGSVQHVNAWLGPAGTVTPLHFDSYDNVLTQAVGHKRVRMYEASQTRYLYPKACGGGGVSAQGNVSAVDIEAPDHARFPEFAQATCLEAVIGPGDGLFIPAGCWHHVRSLSTAFSVSFWF